jgi:hypothetical protein
MAQGKGNGNVKYGKRLELSKENQGYIVKHVFFQSK